MTLIEFIEEKIAVASDFRNLDPINPVELVIEDDESNKFVVVVSHFEPDVTTVPYNVLWINNNPDSEDYKNLLRRVDAEKYDDNGYRYTWSVLSDYSEVFAEPQYWKKEGTPIFGEYDKFDTPKASDENIGIARLTAMHADPAYGSVFVGTLDPRMSDARIPKSHSHEDYARSLLYVATPVDSLGLPQSAIRATIVENDANIGDILVVDSIDENGVVHASWQAPSMELEYVGPKPISMNIIGPYAPVDGKTNHVLRANVVLDDSAVITSVSAKWKIISGSDWGSINENTGVFRANAVDRQREVVVECSWKHPESGEIVTEQITIVIRDASSIVRFLGLRIEGPAQINKDDEPQTYVVYAEYTDGERPVNPAIFTSSNAQAGMFIGGILTPDSAMIFDQTTTLTAVHTDLGATHSATLEVVVKDTDVYPTAVVINGPAQINQSEYQNYTITVQYSDGTTAVRSANSWSLADSTHATVSPTGRVTARALVSPGNKNITLNAIYTEGGVDYNASKQIEIVDNLNYPVSATIAGAATVSPNSTSQYTLQVTYRDGTSAVRSANEWATSDVSLATINENGLMTVADTHIANAVTVSAEYTELGVTVTADYAVSIATIAIPAARWGRAYFANANFTGGVIEPLTADQLMYGVDANVSPNGTTYTKWANVQAFFDDVMVNEIPVSGAQNITVPLQQDEYIYLAWDARATGPQSIMDNVSSLPVTWDGIAWPDEVIGSGGSEPKVLTISVDDGQGPRDWKIIRIDYPGPMAFNQTITFG